MKKVSVLIYSLDKKVGYTKFIGVILARRNFLFMV